MLTGIRINNRQKKRHLTNYLEEYIPAFLPNPIFPRFFEKRQACHQMPTDKMKSCKKTPDNHNPVSFYHNLYLYLWLYTNKRVSSPTSPTSSITRPETEIFLCPIMIRARQTTNTIIIIMFLTALFISSTS